MRNAETRSSLAVVDCLLHKHSDDGPVLTGPQGTWRLGGVAERKSPLKEVPF